MLEEIFASDWIIEEHRAGPLGQHSDRLARDLIDAGYCRTDLKRRFAVVSDLNRWLQKKKLRLSQLGSSS